MKRVVALAAALLCCTSSVFAWDAESFTNGSVYEFDPVMEASTFRLDSGAATLSSSDKAASSGTAVINPFDSIYLDRWSFISALSAGVNQTISGGGMDVSYTRPVSLDSGSMNYSLVWKSVFFASSFVSSPAGNSTSTYFDWSFPYTGKIRFDFSVPDSIDSTSVSFDGSLSAVSELYVNSSPFPRANAASITVYINDAAQRVFYPDSSNIFYFSNIFSSASRITKISFVVDYLPFASGDTNNKSVSFRVDSGFVLSGLTDPLTLSFLTGHSALDGFNDQAQDSINEHESIESQWTGSMTENFNALDLDSFSFPNGLVAAFALITGIFQDLWNGMGEYKILYVFPLTLAIALLLVGRISKFAGNSGSGRNKGGDDDA